MLDNVESKNVSDRRADISKPLEIIFACQYFFNKELQVYMFCTSLMGNGEFN